MKNKLTSILLSVVIAFGLWLYVVTTVSEETTDTFYNIPINFEGETALNEQGLMITSKSHTSAALTVTGNRSDVNSLESDKIILKANVGAINEPGVHPLNYTHSFPGVTAANAISVDSKSPDVIYVTVEERRANKEIPVEVQWIGSPPDGFMSDRENRTLDYSTILITGPASVADQIEKAVIEVDLEDRRESIDQSYRYTLCDANGEAVDAQMITTNVEEVHLTVKIQQVKEVNLALQVTYGGGANENNTVIELSTTSIRLAGSEAVLEELGDTINLGKLNLTEIIKSQVVPYPIILPEGVTNLSNVAEVQASIRFSGLTLKEITVDNFEILNVPEGLTADLITEKLPVIFRGPSGDLAKLLERNVTIVVDFTGAEVGTSTFRPVIRCDAGFETLGAVGVYDVTATIAEKE